MLCLGLHHWYAVPLWIRVSKQIVWAAVLQQQRVSWFNPCSWQEAICSRSGPPVLAMSCPQPLPVWSLWGLELHYPTDCQGQSVSPQASLALVLVGQSSWWAALIPLPDFDWNDQEYSIQACGGGLHEPPLSSKQDWKLSYICFIPNI